MGRVATWFVFSLSAAACSSGTEAEPTILTGPPGSGDPGTTSTDASTGPPTTTSTSSSGSGGSTSSLADSSSSTGTPQSGPETFDEDPGWISFNLPLDGNDYGWRPTAMAGGQPGEIGGFFQAPAASSYYGHVGIEAPSTSPIIASGTLNIVAIDGDYNYNTFFGHFTTGNLEGNRLGFEVLEPNDGGAARVRIQHGTGSVEAFTVTELGFDRDWSYTYDPGAAEFGQITLTLEGQGFQSHALTAEDRAAIESLDAFGFVTRQSDNAGTNTGRLEAYIDDVDYTR